ncbi:MAG TPA: hypothetical protein VK433_11740 [Stellaceae bacterium]|nr:hypothetical protein [Stellaceae bacterium]
MYQANLPHSSPSPDISPPVILTPIPSDRLAGVFGRLAAEIEDPFARGVLAAIAATGADRAEGALAERHRREALALAAEFGIATVEGAPADAFSWDGHRLRADTEAYVLLHEVAHYQLAAPERRTAIDFGLGPGPDTTNREAAERASILPVLERDREEAMVSLLGILWEAECGHPALASFLDQNWLAGVGSEADARHFAAVLHRLHARGFVDATGHPTRRLRSEPDDLSA